MKSYKRISPIQRRRSSRFDMRWMVSIVLAIAVLLGQSSAVMADHGTSLSGTLLEICGDGGSYFITLDENGQKQELDCTHCDYCLSSVGSVQAVHSPDFGVMGLTDFTNISYSTDLANLPDSPEQYWSACRGPPIASIEKNMTSNTSLTTKEPIGSEFTARSIPCV